jgi:hypothetical protein
MKNKKDKKQPTALIITDEAKDNTFVDCDIAGVKIEKKSEGNKFASSNIYTSSTPSTTKWHKKIFWKFLIPVAGSLLVAYLAYYFGWK